jgi:hypothetical protein
MKPYLIILLIFAATIQAQNFRGLDKSPMDKAQYPASHRVNEKIAVITYSRPQLKGRAFEEIVPLNKVWRTGANEASELRLFTDIQIDTKTVKAGTYTIFTIPKEKTVTFIVNAATNLWGSYAYNEDKDVLRITVPRTTVDKSLEAFSIAFSDDDGQPKIHMGWANIRFEVPFTVL